MKFLSFWLFIFLIILKPLNGQEISNLQLFNILTDSLTIKIIESLPENIISLEINSVNKNDLDILLDFIITKLIKSGKKISLGSESDEKIFITFTESKVDYKDLSKNHFWGSYFMVRDIKIAGNFVLTNKSKVFDFNFSSIDTVEFDNYKKLENKIYPLTEGIPPEEPFFLNLIEPVIAIAATATAVILFFTIRSK